MYQKFLMRCCPQKRIRVLYVVADKTNVRTTTYAVKHQVNIGGDETFRTKMHERKTYTIPEKNVYCVQPPQSKQSKRTLKHKSKIMRF